LETNDIDEFDRKVQRGRFSDLPGFDPPEVPRVNKQIMDAKEPKQEAINRKQDDEKLKGARYRFTSILSAYCHALISTIATVKEFALPKDICKLNLDSEVGRVAVN
jgi:hypothetical protein